MKALIKVFVLVIGVTLFDSCLTQQQLVQFLIDSDVLDKLCVNSWTATIKPGTGNSPATIEFKAVISNPTNTQGTGSIRILMGVTAYGLSLPSGIQTISAESKQPYFETPNTTVYPAKTSTAYTTPVLISMAYSPNAVFDIEIHKWTVIQNSWDNTPCHNLNEKGVPIKN